MLLALYIVLTLILLYISYKDIKEAQYNNFYFYFLIIIVSAIAILFDVPYIKIGLIYLALFLSHIFKDKYIEYIGDGDVDLYILLFMIFSFQKYLILIIISTISAIIVNLIKNHVNKKNDRAVRLVPYISFAFLIIMLFDLFKEKILWKILFILIHRIFYLIIIKL